MKFLRRAFALTFLVLSASQTVYPQDWMSETQIVKSDNNSCEVNAAVLDALAQKFRETSERIFVIARMGRGETSRSLNRARLFSARFQLLDQRELDPTRVLFAEGERVKDEGRLEFYLGSKLSLVAMAKRNKGVCLTCCEDYIPPQGKSSRKPSRR